MNMKKSAKNARSNNRAVLEDLGNKEWRFVEIPYEAEMKFNDLLDARDFGSVTPAEMERQLKELLHEAPNFIDVYHHLAMLLDQRGKVLEASLLWQQAVNIGMRSKTAPFCGPIIHLVFNTWKTAIPRWRSPPSKQSYP